MLVFASPYYFKGLVFKSPVIRPSIKLPAVNTIKEINNTATTVLMLIDFIMFNFNCYTYFILIDYDGSNELHNQPQSILTLSWFVVNVLRLYLPCDVLNCFYSRLRL